MPAGGDMVFQAGEKDQFGHAKLGGIGQNVSNKIKELAPKYNGGKKIDMISMNLGYLVRSGAPDAVDAIVPTVYGNLAVDCILKGETGRMVGLRGGRYGSVPIDEVVSTKKVVDVGRCYDTDRYRPRYDASSCPCWYSAGLCDRDRAPRTTAGMMRKRVLLVPDGMADEPQAALGGSTPLEAAPRRHGRLVRDGIAVGAHRPRRYAARQRRGQPRRARVRPGRLFSGRSPLEAASIGVELGPADVSYRLNLVTVAGGLMKDNTAGHIGSDEARRCIEALQAELGSDAYEFHVGVSYRHLFVWRSGALVPAPAARHPRPAGRRAPARRGGRRGRRGLAGGRARRAPVSRERRARARPARHGRVVLGRGYGTASTRRFATTSASAAPWSAPSISCAASDGSPAST